MGLNLKRFFLIFLAVWFLLGPVLLYAEMIIMKNGTVVEAKIVEKDDDYIKVEKNGKREILYLEKIKYIDGKKVYWPAGQSAKIMMYMVVGLTVIGIINIIMVIFLISAIFYLMV